MKGLRPLLLAVLLGVVFLGWWQLPPGAMTLDAIGGYQQQFAAFADQYPWQTAGAFFLAYVAITALSIPGATAMTLLAGAQFGLLYGTLLVSFASTAGATLAMLISRYLLRDYVQQRFASRLARVNTGIAQDGVWYLFALRLMPVFPFFVVNLLMGLSSMPLWPYWWISQLAMLPATLIYLNAGHQLSQLHSLGDILSPAMVLALLLIGVLPLVLRLTFPYLRRYFADRKSM